MITDLPTLIDACKQELHDREYTSGNVDATVKEWDAVLLWCSGKGYTEFSESIGYEYCDEVIGSHILVAGMSHRNRKRLRAVRMLTSYQAGGDFEFRTPRAEHSFEGVSGELMAQFLQHERARGLSAGTLDMRERALRHLNRYLNDRDIGFEDLSVEKFEEYFRASGFSPAARHTNAGHLRLFFRYLYDQGVTSTNIAVLILKDRYGREREVPTTYTEDEITKLLDSVERGSAIGKRDYLILLLAAEYGWRSGDIVRFKFSQIDWDNNTIAFSQNKTGVPVVFPLLSSVGNAIIDYLKHGRPASSAPEVIVSHKHTTMGNPISRVTVHSVVSKYMNKANISHWREKRHGAHALRHSLASNLLKNNIAMPTISTVLGHQSTQTTRIYLKVDIEQLSLCPLPIPRLSSPHYAQGSEE